MGRKGVLLLVANLACASALIPGVLSPARLGAQTGPKKINCCESTTEENKFCCYECCYRGPICTSSKQCNLADE